jgi:hypothetical protein
MSESLNFTPEELAEMTPLERRKALRERTRQDGQRWLEKNCPDFSNQKPVSSFEELIQKLKETFGS